MTRWTALVLAGSRGTADPVAAHERIAHKALVEVGGVSMIERVVAALQSSPSVGRVVLALGERAMLDALPALKAQMESGRVEVVGTAGSPALSVEAALSALGAPFPLLVTTSDHALLTPAMVERFLADTPAGTDVAVGLATRTAMFAKYPDAKRTWLRFGGEGYSGCNLFAFRSERARAAVAFWVQMERFRKTPWRIAARIGWLTLARYAIGLLSLEAAFARLSSVAGAEGRAVVLPWPEAAIDVDKVSDLVQVRAILAARGG